MGRDRESGRNLWAESRARRRQLLRGRRLFALGAPPGGLAEERRAAAAATLAAQMPLRLAGPAPPLPLPPWRWPGQRRHRYRADVPRQPDPYLLWDRPAAGSPAAALAPADRVLPSIIRGQPVIWAGTGWTGQAVKLGDYLFVGAVDRTLYALRASTGQVLWRYRARGMFQELRLSVRKPAVHRQRR